GSPIEAVASVFRRKFQCWHLYRLNDCWFTRKQREGLIPCNQSGVVAFRQQFGAAASSCATHPPSPVRRAPPALLAPPAPPQLPCPSPHHLPQLPRADCGASRVARRLCLQRRRPLRYHGPVPLLALLPCAALHVRHPRRAVRDAQRVRPFDPRLPRRAARRAQPLPALHALPPRRRQRRGPAAARHLRGARCSHRADPATGAAAAKPIESGYLRFIVNLAARAHTTSALLSFPANCGVLRAALEALIGISLGKLK
ncbi:hypothetical protein EMIHUDRAFT_441551, partial [Emiliania huxleyi CCMP1516]|uniref:Uncharacterized protein n=2 Tax=Emiliania huxleyi TaxID=2903 RepID=A0A0D3KCI7_EMIH1